MRERELCEVITASVGKTVKFFEERLQPSGSYGDDVTDVACYFKSPMMFIVAGKPDLAARTLDYSRSVFLRPDGDYMSSATTKSVKPEYVEFYSYANGWLTRAGNALRRIDVTSPSYVYLHQYFHRSTGGFLTHKVDSSDGVTDILTTAHHGLLNLEMGQIELAEAAGQYLLRNLFLQPDLGRRFFLRMNKEGALATEFSPEAAWCYTLSKTEPNQVYFMIGYPMAYLALLYKATGKQEYLDGARQYLEFALSCNESIFSCNFSHKIAWACSIIYSITGDERCLDAVERITRHFVSTQSREGLWYPEDKTTAFDQSAEIACWLCEIRKNLSEVFEKKEGRMINRLRCYFETRLLKDQRKTKRCPQGEQ